MNSIRKFTGFSRFFSFFTSANLNKSTFIGRWSVPNSSTLHINQIVDRNNEDHCGVCVTINTENSVNDNKENKIKMNDKVEDYYLAFIL